MTLLCVTSLVGPRGSAGAADPQHPFDGVWQTVLSCTNSNGALGYSFDFPSVVKNDELHGERGTKDQPGWLSLEGRIQPDGRASLYASGRVGAAPYAVGQRPAGTQYGYHIDAKFSSSAGSGHRVEGRPCTVTFDQGQSADQGEPVGITFVGRMVSDLDRSVAFYEALGFIEDPAAKPIWRTDPVVEHLYSIRDPRGVETRMAKMYVVNADSGERFVVYLRELKGLERTSLADHTAWDPGVTHFALVVADAHKLWGELRARGMLHARSWGGELIAPPGQTRGMIAYVTDPDGLDIELIDQRPAVPAQDGHPGRPAFLPGVNHVGVVVLDSDKARAFYGELLGGRLVTTQAPWLKGDFYDSAVGAHGNILRFYNESFFFDAESPTPAMIATGRKPTPARMNVELVEFQNRKKPVEPRSITDIGVGYVGFEVRGLDAFLAKARGAGATVVSDGIVTMRGGTREVIIRDPDVGAFIELYEHPQGQTH